MRVHATAIAVGGRAALLRGPSGAGKSDLALRCLATGRSSLLPEPAELVADDQVELTVAGGNLLAAAPHSLKGLLEVRGIGIVCVPAVSGARVVLVVDLVARAAIERLPDENVATELAGVRLPVLLVDPFEAAAAQKVLLMLSRHAGGDGPEISRTG